MLPRAELLFGLRVIGELRADFVRSHLAIKVIEQVMSSSRISGLAICSCAGVS